MKTNKVRKVNWLPLPVNAPFSTANPPLLTPTKHHKSVAYSYWVSLLTVYQLPLDSAFTPCSNSDTICPYLNDLSAGFDTLLFSLSVDLQIILIPLSVLITFPLCKLFLKSDFKCRRSSRLRTRPFDFSLHNPLSLQNPQTLFLMTDSFSSLMYQLKCHLKRASTADPRPPFPLSIFWLFCLSLHNLFYSYQPS